MRNRIRNIHGHNHSNSIADEKFVNVSIELTCGWPIAFEHINNGSFTTHNISTPEEAYWQTRGLSLFDWDKYFETVNSGTNDYENSKFIRDKD